MKEKNVNFRNYIITAFFIFFGISSGVFAQTLAEETNTYISEKAEVYPNPSINSCNVSLPEPFNYSDLRIDIFDITGSVCRGYVCFPASEHSFVIDLTRFSSGTYSLQITNNRKVYYQKIIVTR